MQLVTPWNGSQQTLATTDNCQQTTDNVHYPVMFTVLIFCLCSVVLVKVSKILCTIIKILSWWWLANHSKWRKDASKIFLQIFFHFLISGLLTTTTAAIAKTMNIPDQTTTSDKQNVKTISMETVPSLVTQLQRLDLCH